MSKISEIVKVRGGYANFVQLRSALQEAEENSDRMAMYRPTTAHRKALERICRGLYVPNDKKFYLLSGSYGTGKSHLCLMLANILGKNSDDPALKAFYENYAKLDAQRANELRNARQGGQYLVVVCDYGSGKKFEDEILRALVEECANREIDISKFTEFAEANRLLTDWEEAAKKKQGVRDFFADFSKALEQAAPGMPVNALRDALKRFDRDAMERFSIAYALAQGVDFQPKSANLVGIVRDLVRSKDFKDKFTGLAIFFDEFGTGVLQDAKYDTAVTQAFMEDICQHESNVIFVGCIHRDFKDYAQRANQKTAAVMDARITQVPLANEGIEEIIGAIVETEKQSPVWQSEVVPKTGVFDKLTPLCESKKLFPWIEDTARIREKVLEDIYGVHPMALHCLLKLSSEVGSDARSTFTFFSGGGADDAPGSYTRFIAQSDITGPNGALRMLLVDQLFEFFARELSPGSKELREMQRGFVNGYVASLQALKKSLSNDLFQHFDEGNDERVALLRTILVFSLCSVPTTSENIQFARYCLSKSEENLVKKLLGDLEKAGAVYLRRPSNTYELCATEGQDPVVMVDSYAASDEVAEMATVAELLRRTECKEEFLVANNWNLPFSEDKRLKRVYVRGRELGKALWESLHQEMRAAGAKFQTSYEGVAVYCLCEDEGEINLAKGEVKTLDKDNILVAIPHEPTPFREELKKVIACHHFIGPEEANKHPAQTVARIRDMLDNGMDDCYLEILRKIVTSVRSGAMACWYELGGKLLVDRPPQSHKPADMLCERLFTSRSQIKHVDFNLVHDDKWQKSNNTPLKQAVAQLLDFDTPVQIDNGNPENHGEKRYLQKVLLSGCGALVPIPGGDGPVKRFVAQSDPTKIDDKFPVLKELIQRLASLSASQHLVLSDFLREKKAPPYGAGGTMLVLAIAHAVRAFGERLLAYSDSTHSEVSGLASYEAIVAAIADPSCKIEIAIRDISKAQRGFLDSVAKAVSAPALAHGEQRGVLATTEALRKWWAELPAVAKVAQLYPSEHRDRMDSLRQIFDDRSLEPFELLFGRLPTLYAGEPVDALNEKQAQEFGQRLESDIKRFSSGLASAAKEIAAAVAPVFGASGDLLACGKAIQGWWESLTPDQRDPMRSEDHDDAHRLMSCLANPSKEMEQLIMASIPSQWGLGAVRDWTSLQTAAFKSKWEQAKKFIEDIKPLVPEPTVTTLEYISPLMGNVWEIEDGAKIRIAIPPGAKSVIYTLGSETAGEALKKITLQETSDVALDLNDLPTGALNIYAVDGSGNTGRRVTYRVRHKKKQHQVVIQREDLLGEKGSFKFPDTATAFAEVVTSLTDQSVKRGIIPEEVAQQIKSTLGSLKK